jgi:hypothetical protein
VLPKTAMYDPSGSSQGLNSIYNGDVSHGHSDRREALAILHRSPHNSLGLSAQCLERALCELTRGLKGIDPSKKGRAKFAIRRDDNGGWLASKKTVVPVCFKCGPGSISVQLRVVVDSS